jgi:hypothetical protein
MPGHRETFEGLRAPLHTFEACLSEAVFLLGHVKGGSNALLALVSRGIIVSQLRLASEIEAVRKLITKYAAVPMSLANACLVRMIELDPRATVIALDNGTPSWSAPRIESARGSAWLRTSRAASGRSVRP